MATVDGDEPEMLLAGLELTRGLTIQMTGIGTLGLVIRWRPTPPTRSLTSG